MVLSIILLQGSISALTNFARVTGHPEVIHLAVERASRQRSTYG